MANPTNLRTGRTRKEKTVHSAQEITHTLRHAHRLSLTTNHTTPTNPTPKPAINANSTNTSR